MLPRYPCFVSYAHGNGALLSGFRDAFSKVLEAELDAYFADEFWIDQNKFKNKETGQVLDKALAKGICESVCVIVLFVPKYVAKEWCMRELATALRIERERLEILGNGAPDGGLVIPIVLRGGNEDLPLALREKLWADFRAFSLQSSDITKNSDQYQRIQHIAKHIYQVYTCMVEIERKSKHNWCPDGDHCKLEDAEVMTRNHSFPNREDTAK